MKVVEDLERIAKYQMQLKSKFFFAADKRPKPLLTWKAPTGKVAYEVNYINSQRIWGCYIMDPYNTVKHWNGFGVGEPARGKVAIIDFSICFVSSKEDLSQNGVFLENEEGEILIGHSGDIKKGKELFWEKYSGEVVHGDFEDSSKEQYAIVANLSSDECLKEFATFVKMVQMIKKPKKVKKVKAVKEAKVAKETNKVIETSEVKEAASEASEDIT